MSLTPIADADSTITCVVRLEYFTAVGFDQLLELSFTLLLRSQRLSHDICSKFSRGVYKPNLDTYRNLSLQIDSSPVRHRECLLSPRRQQL